MTRPAGRRLPVDHQIMNSVLSNRNPALGIPSPGQLLSAKREEYGWSRRDVARELHLSERQIEAIEQDDYTQLPEKTYVMGYWRSYAQLLEMSIEESIQVHRANLDGHINSLSAPSGHTEVHGKVERSRKRGALLFGLLLVIFLVAVWYWQDPDAGVSEWIGTSMKKFSQSNTQEAQDAVIETEPAPAEEPAATGEPASNGAILALPEPNFSENQEVVEINTRGYEVLVFESPLPAPPPAPAIPETAAGADTGASAATSGETAAGTGNTAQSGTPAQAEDQVASAETPPEETAAGGSAPAASQSEAAPEPAPAPVDHRIVFHVSKESWIDVRDSTGERLIYRTVNRGEDIQLTGTPPYSVFIGSAEGVRVQYRGEEVPFEAHESGLFARFEVGAQ